MIYFLLSLLCSVLVSVFMRASEKHIRNNLTMLACNYAACTVLAAVFTRTFNLFPRAEGMGVTLFLGLISGVLFLGAFVLLQWNIRQNGVSLPSTFMKLGVVVPTLMAITLFGETPTFVQIAGIVMVIIAIILIQSGKNQDKAVNYGALIALLLVGGAASAMTKVYDFYGVEALENHFLFYNFGVAFLLCVMLCLWKKQGLGLMDALFGFLIGVPNYLSSLFSKIMGRKLFDYINELRLKKSLEEMLICGRLFFKERLTRRQLWCIGLILVSLILLNL